MGITTTRCWKPTEAAVRELAKRAFLEQKPELFQAATLLHPEPSRWEQVATAVRSMPEERAEIDSLVDGMSAHEFAGGWYLSMPR